MNQKDNLILQTYMSSFFLMELKFNNFIDSDFFKNMNFQIPGIKESLPSTGLDNQGTLLLLLYSMLVIPKQLLEQEFPEEFERVNSNLKNYILSEETTYKYDIKKGKINYLHKIRNAVAHARVEFDPQSTVTFKDVNAKTDESCTITMKLENVGLLLTDLQKIFSAYIKTIKQD